MFSYISGGALLFNNDENEIASYYVGIEDVGIYHNTLQSNDETRIVSTIENLDWVIPDKVLVNGEESEFTYDSNHKELIVPLNQSNGKLEFKVNVIGKVNVGTDKFDSNHKWNTTNVFGAQAKINNIEKNSSAIIENTVIDSEQNLTVNDMFDINQKYSAASYIMFILIPIFQMV